MADLAALLRIPPESGASPLREARMFHRPGFRLASVLLVAGLAFGATPRSLAAGRVAVSVGEFRSSVSELDPRAAADMLVTALLNAGHYRVLRNGKYLFEGTIAKAGASSSDQHHGISLGGLNLGSGKSKATLSIDVRVSIAATGEIVDSVSLSRPLTGSSSSVNGVAPRPRMFSPGMASRCLTSRMSVTKAQNRTISTVRCGHSSKRRWRSFTAGAPSNERSGGTRPDPAIPVRRDHSDRHSDHRGAAGDPRNLPTSTRSGAMARVRAAQWLVGWPRVGTVVGTEPRARMDIGCRRQ